MWGITIDRLILLNELDGLDVLNGLDELDFLNGLDELDGRSLIEIRQHSITNRKNRNNRMKEGCLICQAPLEYLEQEITMECELCHQTNMSKARCVNGHYICDECHTKGLDSIIGYCMTEKSKNPIDILERMMDMPFCHMHGPEHHTLVGSALLTAYHNAGGEIELWSALKEMSARGQKVPGGVCGFWGSCGAAISTGMFMSIISEATPLTGDSWGQANLMTSKSLQYIGEVGGPRCCKRNSYLALQAAAEYIASEKGIVMEITPTVCSRLRQNKHCIGKRCPFHLAHKAS